MDTMVLSPEQLWSKYTLPEADLNTRSVFKTEDTESGLIRGQVFIDGRMIDGTAVRISMRYSKPNEGEELPSLVLLGKSGESISDSERDHWAASGYIALSVDYSACDDENPTVYPQGFGYCNHGNCGRYYTHVDSTAEDTVWFNWSYSVRRAVYYLSVSEKSSNISVVAYGDAAKIAMMVLGVDDRLSAGAVLFGNIWENCNPDGFRMDLDGESIDDRIAEKNKSEEEALRRLTAIAPQTYAERIKVPVLVMLGTNSLETDITHTYEAAGRMSDLCSVCLIPRAIDSADEKYSEYIRRWLKKPCGFVQIQMSAEEKEGSLILRADLKNLTSVSEVKIYYRRGDNDWAVANWTEALELVHLFDVCEGECEVIDVTQPILFFCNAVQMGQLFSSKMMRIVPESVGSVKPCEKTRILYKGKQGAGEFIPLNPIKEQDALFLKENTVAAAVGPYEVSGVKGRNLSVFCLNDSKYIFDESMTFSFDVYAKEPCEMTVYITSMWGTAEQCVYRNVQKLLGGDLWQKISLPFSELKLAFGKAGDGQLKRVVLSFCSDEEIIINNLLVI